MNSGIRVSLSGKVVGRLTITDRTELRGRADGNGTRRYWWCACSCGNEKWIGADKLAGRVTVSCGCVRREVVSASFRKHGQSRRTPEYRAWAAMKQRCFNEGGPAYKNWGGRGIKVCDEWLNSFEQFFADMGRRPAGTSLERENNDGDYSPGNCKWGTRTEQSQNTRTAVRLTFKGETLCLSEWARRCGLLVCTMRRRIIRLGAEKAIGEALATRDVK